MTHVYMKLWSLSVPCRTTFPVGDSNDNNILNLYTFTFIIVCASIPYNTVFLIKKYLTMVLYDTFWVIM